MGSHANVSGTVSRELAVSRQETQDMLLMSVPHQSRSIHASCSPHLLKFESECVVGEFLSQCFYQNGSDYTDVSSLQQILLQCTSSSPNAGIAGLVRQSQNILAYLAIPPHLFASATQSLKSSLVREQRQLRTSSPTHSTGMGFVRIVLEKPFGHDTASCVQLLQALSRDQGWSERDLFRIDHYLGKVGVRNIVTLRQQAWLRAKWNRRFIRCVHIVWKEPFGIEGRGNYFDGYGIIRDVIQNHLVQILSLLAMELPQVIDPTTAPTTTEAIRNAKVRVLKSIPTIHARDCMIGQYSGYLDDASIVNKDSKTCTYACIRTRIDNDRWRGVTFLLEAGKALDEHLCEARLHFRSAVLILRIQPNPLVYWESSSTLDWSKHAELHASTKPASVAQTAQGRFSSNDEYASLILDTIRGRSDHFVRSDELLEAWRIFTSLLNHLDNEQRRPSSYAPGTLGPDGRSAFVEAERTNHGPKIRSFL
jgi:glucose-6-phosphate 1-dehydrogenase